MSVRGADALRWIGSGVLSAVCIVSARGEHARRCADGRDTAGEVPIVGKASCGMARVGVGRARLSWDVSGYRAELR
ncbi:hypothetical protein C8J57DRAFT_1301162 [Mycena rebaudengoi]|nr:hypothetical protein C8J57DRAFT_1301162 [Mycena rebaudengoi]